MQATDDNLVYFLEQFVWSVNGNGISIRTGSSTYVVNTAAILDGSFVRVYDKNVKLFYMTKVAIFLTTVLLLLFV